MIPDDVIQMLVDRISIVDIIGKVTEVKKSGKNYMARCPFHNERTPSMSISDEKGLYHCFGCGASGNTIKFLMDYYRVNFREALEKLADMAGIDLSQYEDSDNKSITIEKKAIQKITGDALDYFHNKLLNSEEAENARKYLSGRKLTPETIKFFKIGYGGLNHNLFQFLKSKGYSEDFIYKSGLCIKSNDGVYDRFRDRVIFPIFDREGNPVGFGGRILQDRKDIAKYVNSPENSVFHKGYLLFALNYAKDEIIKQKIAYVVEGYMDVIALFQHNIKNVVAPLGTSITENQILQLKRYTSNIVFIFDGDEAGINAANRAIDIAANLEVNIKVVILPGKMDPYDFVMKYGKAKTIEYFDKKLLDPIDFKLIFFSKKISVKKDKISFVRNIFLYIRTIKTAIEREAALKKTANFISEKLETVLIEYQNFLKKESSFGRLIDNKNSKNEDIEMEFIGGMIKYIEKSDEVLPLISSEMLINSEVRNLFLKIENGEKNTKTLLFGLNNELVDSISRGVMDENFTYEMVLEKAYKIRYLHIKRKLINVRDLEEKKNLKRELFELEEIIKSFSHAVSY
ncbi:MAG: DNA primase [Brevinematales bacterium]|nr:DNA primase [Brevinematales bacterium]